MNLERITVEFHAEEDRLRIRLFFGGQSEVMLWLTRRIVKRLWPVLVQMAQATPAIRQQPNPEARKAVLGFQHEQALQDVQFSKGVQEPPGRSHPLGDAPIVVSKVHARRNASNQTLLALLPSRGQGVHLAVSDTLLHGLLKLIQDTAAKAEWDLALVVPTFSVATAEDGCKPLAH